MKSLVLFVLKDGKALLEKSSLSRWTVKACRLISHQLIYGMALELNQDFNVFHLSSIGY
jgi:hypothetical protein